MKRIALILALPLGASAATLTLNGQVFNCSEIRTDPLGNVVATCKPQAPISAPVRPSCVNPAGETIQEPAGIVMQALYMGGTNNYVVDDARFVNPPPGTDSTTILSRVTTKSPAGSIQVFTIPRTWPDGQPAQAVAAFFADWLLSGIGVQYEIALSTCRGDFAYYKTPTATNTDFGIPLQPCGIVSGPNFSLNWSAQGSFSACKTGIAPNATWYLNWRIVPGTAGNCSNVLGGAYHTCGLVFMTNPF